MEKTKFSYSVLGNKACGHLSFQLYNHISLTKPIQEPLYAASICEFIAVWIQLISRDLVSSLCSGSYTHCLLLGSLNPERRNFMEASTTGLYSLRCIHLYILFLAVGLCICSLQLKEETSLMMVEQGTDLCFGRTVIIDFTLGHQAVYSHHTNNAGNWFHLVEWVLNKIRYFG